MGVHCHVEVCCQATFAGGRGGRDCVARGHVVATALLGATLAPAGPALAVSADHQERGWDELLPVEGRIDEGELYEARAEGPVAILRLEGEAVDEPVVYDLSEVSEAGLQGMLEVAPLVYPDQAGQVSPQLSYGVGWYLYYYLNNSDVQTLRTAGAPAFGAAICAAGGPFFAAACAVLAAMIESNLPATTVPYGYCVEVAVYAVGFPLTPRLKWTKLVKRTCSCCGMRPGHP